MATAGTVSATGGGTMARLAITDDDLVVCLSWWEKAVVRRREVRVPIPAVRRVAVEPDWWRALRGTRGPGIWIPGLISLGLRPHPTGTDFAALRPGRPVLCVDLDRSSPYARLAVTDPDPGAAAQAVRAAAGSALMMG